MGTIVCLAIPDKAADPRPETEAREAAAAGKDAHKFYTAPFDLSIRLGFKATELDKHFLRGHGTDRPEWISLGYELEQLALLAALGKTPPDGTTIDEGTRQLLQPRIELLFHDPDYAIAIVGTEEWLNPILAHLGERCTDGTPLPRIAPWQLIGVSFPGDQVTMTLINREPRPQPVPAV